MMEGLRKAERVLELHQRYPPQDDDVSGVARVLASEGLAVAAMLCAPGL